MFGVFVLNHKKNLLIIIWIALSLVAFINENFSDVSMEYAKNVFSPIISYANGQEQAQLDKSISNCFSALFPLNSYVAWNAKINQENEDYRTYKKVLSHGIETEEKQELSTQQSKKSSLEKLKNFDYLLEHYYTVDGSTMVDESLLNAKEMLAKNLTINTKEKEPKVLIFHTHAQEAFQDSVKGDSSTTIVGMGAYLAELLNNRGISTIHHKGVYDLVDGKLDRSKAYELSEEGVLEVLKEYPSIEVVIDLHRDGVNENTHLVTEIEGKQTAQIMFFNGLSRTKTNGEISYLPNPYIKDNLAFSFQMQLACEEMYPGFARRIYLKGYRYSLHMMPKSLLIEAGAQNNTVQEMRSAMECLSNVLCRVLQKTS